MNFRALADWKPSGLTRINEPIQNAGFTPISRRRFTQAAAGTAFAGTIGHSYGDRNRAAAASFAQFRSPVARRTRRCLPCLWP